MMSIYWSFIAFITKQSRQNRLNDTLTHEAHNLLYIKVLGWFCHQLILVIDNCSIRRFLSKHSILIWFAEVPSYVSANEGMSKLFGTAKSNGAYDGAFDGLRVGVMDGDWDEYSVG
jgi:hypothetical protein